MEFVVGECRVSVGLSCRLCQDVLAGAEMEAKLAWRRLRQRQSRP